MYVYIITEKYYDEDFRIITNIICACKDKNTAKDKMKDYECVLESLYETLVLKVKEWEVI